VSGQHFRGDRSSFCSPWREYASTLRQAEQNHSGKVGNRKKTLREHCVKRLPHHDGRLGAMLHWFKSDWRRTAIRQDRKFVLVRARRFLISYLASDDLQKQKCYELVAGAAAGCQPHLSNPHLNNTELSKTIAETALRVVKAREGQATQEPSAISITDAYATVTMAYRRAAAIYVLDEELQQIGTAAVHLVTMANSYMAAAHSTDTTLASRQN
jgi:hypothetical protein